MGCITLFTSNQKEFGCLGLNNDLNKRNKSHIISSSSFSHANFIFLAPWLPFHFPLWPEGGVVSPDEVDRGCMRALVCSPFVPNLHVSKQCQASYQTLEATTNNRDMYNSPQLWFRQGGKLKQRGSGWKAGRRCFRSFVLLSMDSEVVS